MTSTLSLILQSLTPESQSVLNHSIAEATRRKHAQTTPLHVAATLLRETSRFLEEACIRSHPNASHPLQRGALKLCFGVALERMPRAQCIGDRFVEPHFSNALMASLKRLQRRGCSPEQQPLPKVELHQLVLSILDDPSVSRVMREASFSSLAVKAVIEQTLNPQPNSEDSNTVSPGIGLGFNLGPKPVLCLGTGVCGERNSYVNPRLLGCGDDVKRVLDVLSRVRKRNPVLVGEFGPCEVVKMVLGVIKKDEIHDRVLKGVEVISVEKELVFDCRLLPTKIKGFEGLIDRKMEVNSKGGSGVIVDLGDLKWLVDQPSNQQGSMVVRGVVSEMGRILRRYGEGSRIWFIGRATCDTYSRCQVHHPTIESEWDLNVVSIVSTPSMPIMLPRLISNGGILSSSVECLTREVSENLDPKTQFRCFPYCKEKYDHEIPEREAEQVDKSSEVIKSDANRHSLPLWLQNANMHANDAVKEPTDFAQSKIRELQTEWSPVKTDLALGPMNVAEAGRNNDIHMDRLKDFLGCEINDMDSFKRLVKGLAEKVGWQTDAASAIASTITRCKTGNGKRRVSGLKGDIWLLFLGPDRVGKKKMSIALSELVYGVSPSVIALRAGRDCGNVRGKTVLDRIAEAVRRNPCSVIMLEDIDEADLVVRGSIKHAMERGRFIDSHGREISLGNVIFILTSTWTPHQLRVGAALNEEMMTSLASGGWQLRISIGEQNTRKRTPSMLNDDQEWLIKKRKISDQGILFDLNQLAGNVDDMLDGSYNSSDLTVEHEDELTTSSNEPSELLSCVDETIVFKPVDFAPLRHNIELVISSKFCTMLGDDLTVKVESEAVEKILSGIWLGEMMLESWVEKVVVPSIQQLKRICASCTDYSSDRKVSVRLELDHESGSRDFGDWLPSTISVVTNV